MAEVEAGYRGDTALAGEFFVAAELAKRGYTVAITLGNAKAVDLIAERNGRAVCIQVKAVARKYGWAMPPDPAKIVDGVMYVCVVLNAIGEAPSYYVIPPEEVRSRTRFYGARATLVHSQIRDGNFEEAWDLIEKALQPAGDHVEAGTKVAGQLET